MTAHLAQLVDTIPPGAIPVASDLPAPVVDPETVAASVVEDGAARFVVAAVDAVAAAMTGQRTTP